MIGSIVSITLLVFLATKELGEHSKSESARRIASFLTAPIIALLMLFVLILALRIIQILP